MSDQVRFTVRGTTYVEVLENARVELNRFTGMDDLPFTADIVGLTIDMSTPHNSDLMVTHYDAEIRAVL